MGQPRSQRQLGGEEGDEFAELITAGGFGRSGYDELAVADWDVGVGSKRPTSDDHTDHLNDDGCGEMTRPCAASRPGAELVGNTRAARNFDPESADSRGRLVTTVRVLSHGASHKATFEWRSTVYVALHRFALKGAG